MMDKFKEAIHVFNTIRPMQWIVLIFVLWLTKSFHEFYMVNFREINDWQMTAVVAYAGLIFGLITKLINNVMKKKEKDEL